jgi:uncharacterized protein (TIGR02246 family)
MKRKHLACGLFMICLMLLFNCFQETTLNLNLVKQEIEEGNEKLMNAFNQEDFDGIVDLYTDNATILPPNSDIIRGNEAIKEFWQQGHQMGIRDLILTTDTVEGRGDTVCEIGKYKLTVQPEGQESMTDTGKYVVIWKKVDGVWKLHVDIWNTNMPVPG